MLRFLDRNHIPAVPKSFTVSGNKIPWTSRSHTFDAFVEVVRNFAATNGFPVPTKEVIEDAICKQLARGWCTGQTRFDRPVSNAVPQKRERAPCKSCGRRK